METKANYTIVGIMVLVVLAAAFGFVYWFAELSKTGQYARVLIRVPGSAAGLNPGSPVRFNGLAVGQVVAVDIDRQNPKFVVALADINVATPLNGSSVFRLESQGLTGAALFEISTPEGVGDGRLKIAFENQNIIEFNAKKSGLANLLENAETMMVRADNIMEKVETFVGNAEMPLTNTLQNAEKFSEAIAKNSDGIDEFLKNVSSLSETIKTLSSRLEGTLEAADNLISAVDAKKINNSLENFEQLSEDAKVAVSEARRIAETVGDRSGDIDQMISDIGETAGRLNSVTDKVDGLLVEVDPELVRQTMTDISSASSNANQAMADVQKIVGRVGARSDDIDRMISDVTEIAQRLNAASTRVDGVLAKLDGFLGDGDSSSLMADAQETLKSFKNVADNLNKRISPIANNLERFTGSGLQDVEALISETRRSISRIEQSITTIERDPQRLLFGGETVKQYDGRTRR